MAECEFCMLQENMLYEDDQVKALLKDKPAAPGHIVVVPKAHHAILEQVPDEEVAHLFAVANKASALVFDKLQATGTNIIMHNGIAAGQTVPHVAIHIIPRTEDDMLDFQWDPKKVSEEDLDGCALLYKDALKEKKPEPEEKVDEPEKVSGAENYLIKQLERIP